MKKLLLVALGVAALAFATADSARANDVAALTGVVSSQKEGPMEGVVIGAKKEGSTITVNLTSGETGRFSFSRREARSRPVRAENTRRWLRPRRAEVGGGCGRKGDERRH